jgi:hypothetical protein
MRRAVFILTVLVLAVPAAAWPSRTAAGDGTLVVDNGRGVVVVNARGGILGRFDSGNLVITNTDPTNTRVPAVFNADRVKDLGNGRTMYTGSDIRFRLIGTQFHARIQAIGIDVSAVGHGTVTLDASGFADFPGHYSINGGPFTLLPAKLTTFTLGQD